MKNIKNILAVTVAAFVLSSCATVQVTSDYDHTKNFSTMKTFALHQNTVESATISSLNKERIVNAVRSQLVAKGYTESTSNPDFYVNINGVVKDQASVSANTDFYGYGGMYRPYGYWGGGPGMVSANTQFNVDHYQNGSLIIDMVDAKTQKLFWEGTGNKDIDSQVSNPDQAIGDAVAKIMASFPNAGMAAPVTKK